MSPAVSRVNVKVERGSTFSIFSTFHTFSISFAHVNFARVNKIEVMYERPRVNVTVERGSTFAFTRDLPYIASISCTRVKYILRTNAR